MKVFLDTNVLVSGFATRGLSADVVRVVLAEHEFVTGEVVLQELRRVLVEKMRVPESRADDIERLLRRYGVEPVPDEPSVLASALRAGADVLVTGDKDLLDVGDQVRPMQILTPREFWNLLRA